MVMMCKTTLESLRSGIGIVFQETTLFSGTIRDNIAYARRIQDAVIEAAKLLRSTTSSPAYQMAMRLWWANGA